MNFEKADQVVHPVTTQWHYPIMVKYGYEPISKEGVGFVRAYAYIHPDTQHIMTLHTGANADYWRDTKTDEIGYWKSLESHLQLLSCQC